MAATEAGRVAIRFVNEINRHDVAALVGLMAPDFRFTDSLGTEVVGPDRMKATWTAYFEMFPDYQITIRHYLGQGQLVALFGTASGTLAEPAEELLHRNRWTLPAAWRAVVRDGRVVDWQIYADNTPVQKLLTERGRK